MQVFEEGVACVSPRRVEGNLYSVRQFVSVRDGEGSVPFGRAIRALQSPEIALEPACGRPRLVWGRYDVAGMSSALRDLMAVETLDPGCAYTGAERRRNLPVVRDGLRWFRRSFPVTYPVFCKAVPFVLLAKSDTQVSGSVSNRIGLLWLAPSPSWTGQTCGEHLFHEYIHQCLFLEDMVNTVFDRDGCGMWEPENRVPSAVRGVPRRYDQSFHSAFVAAGIAEFRARASDFDGARAVFPRLWLCLDALVRKRHVLSDNGADQLDRLVVCVFRQADSLAVLGPPASTLR